MRNTENLRASTRLYGSDLEISGWWRSSSLTLELEWDEGLAIEQPVAFARLPPDVQVEAGRLQAGRTLIKLEEVWTLGGHCYEAYYGEHHQVVSIDIPESPPVNHQPAR